MQRTIQTEDQIIGILQKHEAGQKRTDFFRKHGLSEGAIWAWKPMYSGPTLSEAKRRLSDCKPIRSQNRLKPSAPPPPMKSMATRFKWSWMSTRGHIAHGFCRGLG